MSFRFYPTPGVQFLTNDGKVLANGSLTFTDTGTSNQRPTWSDPGMTVLNPPAVPLDGAGRPNVDIWGDGSYRVVLKDSFGAVIGTADNVSGPQGIPDPALQAGKFLTNDGTVIFWKAIREVPDPAGQPDGFVLTTDGTNFQWEAVPAAVISAPGLAGTNVDAHALAGYPVAPVTFTLTIDQGVVLSSHAPEAPALDFTGFAATSTINLINKGRILGKGGRGGRGGDCSAAGDGNWARGGDEGEGGGLAIRGPGTGRTFNITNAEGFIFGGGGGGGGAGVAVANGNNFANGGGGGGGAGCGDGGFGGSVMNAEGTTGPKAARGTSGSMKIAGAGGAGTVGGSGTGGLGGNGGEFGAAGTAGASPANTLSAAGGTGGSAGNAIDLAGGAVTFLSGNTADRVKGAVA